MKQKAKALVLFSGGLDSRLVVKLLQEQNIGLDLVNFKFPFGCGCEEHESNFDFSKNNAASLHIVDCTKGKLFREYLAIVKNPLYGYGAGLNPCVHCRIFMLKKAKSMMKKFGADFIATGEVLGQRPMSQYKHVILKIERESGLDGKILRPLSAKFLPETLAEKNHLVDRKKFFGISGRTRSIQMSLAKKYSMKYPTPAGGCLLCDKNYSIKLSDLLNHEKNITPELIAALCGFRHFRSKNSGKIILGRNEAENLRLEEINRKLKWNMIVPEKFDGPTALYQNKKDKSLALLLVKAYTSKNLEERNKFENIRIGIKEN